MLITDPLHIRSIIQESGRQSDFYDRRGDQSLCEMWSSIEGAATQARTGKRSLSITVVESNLIPIPIKPCEQ